MLPTLSLRLEKWKFNREFRVYVSTLGNFRDEHKKNMAFLVSNGYLYIKTPYGIKSAHRLVMLTWRPIPNAEEMTVDHNNHNKRDNSLYNLEWVTCEENQKRAQRDAIKTESQQSIEAQTNRVVCCEFKNLDAAAHKILNTSGKEFDLKSVRGQIAKSLATGKSSYGVKWFLK